MNKTSKKNIGAFVLDQRTKMNISQIELSKKVKMSQAKISKVENGVTELSVSEFDKILKVFGMTMCIWSNK